jgi:hypothetical protein
VRKHDSNLDHPDRLLNFVCAATFFENDSMEFEWREAERGPALAVQRNRRPRKLPAYPPRREAERGLVPADL